MATPIEESRERYHSVVSGDFTPTLPPSGMKSRIPAPKRASSDGTMKRGRSVEGMSMMLQLENDQLRATIDDLIKRLERATANTLADRVEMEQVCLQTENEQLRTTIEELVKRLERAEKDADSYKALYEDTREKLRLDELQEGHDERALMLERATANMMADRVEMEQLKQEFHESKAQFGVELEKQKQELLDLFANKKKKGFHLKRIFSTKKTSDTKSK